MRATLLALTLFVLGVRPAHPGAILYATAASENRIDAFCLDDGGGIAPAPAFQHDLGGTEPRRILVNPQLGNVLYVAQKERISVFQIDGTGRLTMEASISIQDPRDIVVYRDMLYASLHQGQVLGFRLSADGIPMVNICGGTTGDPCSTNADCPTGVTCNPPTTCGGIVGGTPCSKDEECPTTTCKRLKTCGGTTAGQLCFTSADCPLGVTCTTLGATTCIVGTDAYQDIAVDGAVDSTNGALVYVSGGGDPGRIDVFQLDRLGNLLDANGIRQTCPDEFNTCGGTTEGQPCGTDLDCPSGAICRPPTTCGGTTAGQPCLVNGDCPTNEACAPLSTCGRTAGPACSANTDCSSACGGTTEGAVCSTDDDCPSDVKCKPLKCQTLLPPLKPISLRRSLARPKALQIKDGILYVVEKSRNRITAFQLQQPTPANENQRGFCQYAPKQPDGSFTCQTTPINLNKIGKGEWKQPPFSKTKDLERYQQLLLVNQTLVATEFNDGRIDAFKLKTDGKLPKSWSRRGKKDPKRSPIRMTTYPSRDDIVYVAGGIIDRVFVFRLRNGLPETQPFSATLEDRNSFPNDVAVAVLPGKCQ